MASRRRFERPTCPLGGDCSIQLSYRDGENNRHWPPCRRPGAHCSPADGTGTAWAISVGSGEFEHRTAFRPFMSSKFERAGRMSVLVAAARRKKEMPPRGGRAPPAHAAQATLVDCSDPRSTPRVSKPLRGSNPARAQRESLLACNGEKGKDGGVPTGIRTPVTAVKGRCPRPLDDGDAEGKMPTRCKGRRILLAGSGRVKALYGVCSGS